jgi:hypothetical protein
MDPDEAREIEVEVIPPGAQAPPPRASAAPRGSAESHPVGADDPFLAFMAQILDTAFTIPGTKIRFGFDPIIGLLPGVGDTAMALTSLMLIWRSARHGLPRIVLARMALNVLINAAVGAIPVGGDIFSIFFRSNAMNYELFRKHAGAPGVSTRSDWLFVGALIFGTLLALVTVFIAAFAWFHIFVNVLRGLIATAHGADATN